MELELLFEMIYVCKIPKGFGIELDLTQFADKLQCDDYTGCDAVDNYYATDADTMMDILYEYDFHED